jgi:hypothetical protein
VVEAFFGPADALDVIREAVALYASNRERLR